MRLEYEKQLVSSKMISRRQILKQYQKQLENPTFLKVINISHSLPIPKVDHSGLKFSDMMLSRIQDSMQTMKNSFSFDESQGKIAMLADKRLNLEIKKFSLQLSIIGKTTQFVLRKIQKIQWGFYNALICNYTRKQEKKQKIIASIKFRKEICSIKICSIFYHLRNEAQLKRIKMRNFKLKINFARLKKSFIKSRQLNLQNKYLQKWAHYLKLKRADKNYQLSLLKHSYQSIRLNYLLKRELISKQFDLRELQRNRQKRHIFEIIKTFTKICQQEREFSEHFNEFLPKSGNIKVIKL
ncbi:hypothetical protein pb186bvf_019349 [Paramecium bursaria]